VIRSLPFGKGCAKPARIMQFFNLRHASLTALLTMPLAFGPLAACSDDGGTEGGGTGTAETSGTPEESGEGDGDGDPGDGDGDPGDGDGDPGDGDGDSGDGDGDGDGGDGDGDGDSGDGDGDGDGGDGDGDSGDGDGDSGDGDGDGDPVECEPDDAVGVGMCDAFFGYAWNGMECVGVSGCNCNGADCQNIPLELADCEAAHANCDGQPDGCAGLDVMACQNDNACMPINGAMLNPMADCLEPSGFVACGDSAICAEVLTWGCDQNDTQYLFFNSCLPEGFVPCNGPNNDPPEC
jgi:hypothetical protein